MQGPKTIRALQRGLEVIDALQARPISSLHDIHQATRIPKPTLLQILHTLDRAGLVSRRLADGHYRLSTVTGVRRKRDRYDHIAEAAAPVLVRLCERLKWPSDLFVPAGDHMEGRETSRPHSPFVVRSVQGHLIGAQVGWLMSGVGRAYLGWCPEKEREVILRKLRKSDNPLDRLARDPRGLDRILSETRRRGYATRDPSFVGGKLQRPSGLRRVGVHCCSAMRRRARSWLDQHSLDQDSIHSGRVRRQPPCRSPGCGTRDRGYSARLMARSRRRSLVHAESGLGHEHACGVSRRHGSSTPNSSHRHCPD